MQKLCGSSGIDDRDTDRESCDSSMPSLPAQDKDGRVLALDDFDALMPLAFH